MSNAFAARSRGVPKVSNCGELDKVLWDAGGLLCLEAGLPLPLGLNRGVVYLLLVERESEDTGEVRSGTTVEKPRPLWDDTTALGKLW